MSYTVLARRYRSETFDDVVGQEAVARTLKNAIETGRVAHAYLFSGTRGVGKTSMARIMAKALNCFSDDNPTTTPCCTCESCVAINEGNDIDVLEIDGASNTGVEHIRELRQNAIYRPARARYKIYIIDEVHMLSVSAFNALLKTLEEPPEHVKFILATTEPNKVLPTILSRCQKFDFRNIQIEDITGHLNALLKSEGVDAEEALVRKVARLARGSMRDALSLLDQLLSMSDQKLTLGLLEELMGTPRSERIIELADALGKHDVTAALTQTDQALNEGLALEQLTSALQDHFRDLMVLRSCGADTELVDLIDQQTRETVIAQSKEFDESALVYFITVMEELKRAIKSSGSGRALLEAAIVRLTATDRFSDTKALIEKVKTLQTSGPAAAPAGNYGAPQQAVTRPAAQPRPAQPQPQRQQAAPARRGFGAAPVETAAPAPAQPKQTGLVKPASYSADYFKDHWAAILSEFEKRNKKHLMMYLKEASVIGFNGRVLSISLANPGLVKMLEDRGDLQKEINDTLTAICETAMTVTFAAGSAEKKTTKPTMSERVRSAQGNGIMSPGSRPSQDEVNAAMCEKTIQDIQHILGGKVCSIERINPKQ